MKLALLLNAVNPSIGGVLIRGDKGTAKSTAVRAMADLLGGRPVVEGCRFSCDPNNDAFWCADCREKTEHKAINQPMRVINLPVSATEDRVVGTLDIEHVLKHGEKRFEPGILASANRNILYVDEVNLLDDHIVDLLLDSAAMGVNSIEREGVSYSHPAKFVLVGTMNPEEGDLRPQLIDRFGLVVDVKGETEIDLRAEVVHRRLTFEENPEAFRKQYQTQQNEMREKIRNAKISLPQVTYTAKCLEYAARLGIALKVDGHRADITLIKTATTCAAMDGRLEVTKEDILEAACLALPHRLRRRPFEEGSFDRNCLAELLGDER